MNKSIKILKEKRDSNKVLILGHHAQDYKSVLKYPFPYETKRGLHQPAPTSLLHDNWQDFKGDIITCHYKNFNSKFVGVTFVITGNALLPIGAVISLYFITTSGSTTGSTIGILSKTAP